MDVIREWMRDCDTHQCLHSEDEPFLPTRLLDVGKHGSNRSRLICDTKPLVKTERYLALSHQWGAGGGGSEGKRIDNTYKSNLETLKLGVNDSEFPPKYQDAIFVARELNIQYLWIDSLCIIQQDMSDSNDKSEDWGEESQRMEQVFRSAYATIAASCAASSAEHFLKARPERQCVTMRKGTASYYLCNTIDDFDGDVEDGELNKRGWVFQERALSRRTIYFTEKQTYWECGEGVRCETLTRMRRYVLVKMDRSLTHLFIQCQSIFPPWRLQLPLLLRPIRQSNDDQALPRPLCALHQACALIHNRPTHRHPRARDTAAARPENQRRVWRPQHLPARRLALEAKARSPGAHRLSQN
jgi:hypothetical protein